MPLPTFHDGVETRILAALPPRPTCAVPPLAASAPLLPRGQWRETDLSVYGAPVLDQGRQSSCVGHATCTVASVAWAQRGNPFLRFSPTFVYAQINGGVDRGAVIADAATELATKGICLEDECPEGMIYARQIPASAYQTALKYRLSRWHHCPNFDSIGTALSYGWPVVFGVLVGANFAPDSRGLVPVPDRVLGGHALAAIGLRKLGNDWIVKFQNSWTPRWGLGGSAFFAEGFLLYSAQRYGGRIDAFAAESFVAPVDDDGPIATEA